MMVVLLLLCLVVIPGLLGLLFSEAYPSNEGCPLAGNFQVGDAIVYRKQKVSRRPGPRAKEVTPAPFGETYSYLVEKYWTVEDLTGDDHLVATTRTHKHHCLRLDDPNLRKAGWFERLRHWSRFPQVDQPA
jgi:hypothetical protein